LTAVARRCGIGGGNVSLSLQGAPPSVMGAVEMELEAPAGVELLSLAAVQAEWPARPIGYSADTVSVGSLPLVLVVGRDLGAGAHEMMVWLRLVVGGNAQRWRPNRLVLVVE
jgi:hypothetical protein